LFTPKTKPPIQPDRRLEFVAVKKLSYAAFTILLASMPSSATHSALAAFSAEASALSAVAGFTATRLPNCSRQTFE
jgi:F0F1-type ATP synthase assembly protein I